MAHNNHGEERAVLRWGDRAHTVCQIDYSMLDLTMLDKDVVRLVNEEGKDEDDACKNRRSGRSKYNPVY